MPHLHALRFEIRWVVLSPASLGKHTSQNHPQAALYHVLYHASCRALLNLSGIAACYAPLARPTIRDKMGGAIIGKSGQACYVTKSPTGRSLTLSRV